MTPDRVANAVRRWVRLYTRGLPASVAERRAEEVDADLLDHIAHERADGTGDRRIALAVASRMVRGLPADAAWRDGVIRAHPWTPADARTRGRSAYRRAVGIGIGATLILVWMIGAVGIIGDSGDAADLLYGGVLGVGLIGALVARFRPLGMARALVAMAVAQLAVGAVALIAGLVPSYNSPLEILVLNAFFAVLFIGSAWLFRRAEGHRQVSGQMGGDASG